MKLNIFSSICWLFVCPYGTGRCLFSSSLPTVWIVCFVLSCIKYHSLHFPHLAIQERKVSEGPTILDQSTTVLNMRESEPWFEVGKTIRLSNRKHIKKTQPLILLCASQLLDFTLIHLFLLLCLNNSAINILLQIFLKRQQLGECIPEQCVPLAARCSFSVHASHYLVQQNNQLQTRTSQANRNLNTHKFSI